MENNKEKCSNLQIKLKSMILAVFQPLNINQYFLLIKLEMSRLHHFEAF